MARRSGYVGALLGSLSACAPAEDAGEPVGAISGAIANGVADTTEDATYPASVSNLGRGCSATLITPRWAISAEHCHEGRVTGDTNFWQGALGEAENHKLEHTNVTSDDIELWTLNGARGTDLSLIKLDVPAEPPWGRPAHPPHTVTYDLQTGRPQAEINILDCGNPDSDGNLVFHGQLVGYGYGYYNEEGYDDECQGPDLGTRRIGDNVAWTWNNGGDGSTYSHEFFSDEATSNDACTDMSGIGVHKDSGGSLYRQSDGALCGVISGDGFWNCNDLEPGLECEYHTVALDDPLAAAWIESLVMDEDHWWDGECEPAIGCPATNCNDPDNDGIASSCDNCPFVWNPEQLRFADADGDSVGDACDFCPGQNVSLAAQTSNRNFEVEFAVHYPMDEQPPILDRANYQTEESWRDAVELYASQFRPDACDPNPVPTFQRLEGGDLPPGTYYTTNTIDPDCVAYTQGCQSYVDNQIQLLPATSDEVQAVGGGNVTVGLRWCDCKDALNANPAYVLGRTRCRLHPAAGCVFDETFYDDAPVAGAPWQRITTKPDTGGWSAPSDYGKEWVLAAGTGNKTVTWNFDALGVNHVVDITNKTYVTGILWSHVDALSVIGQPGIPAIEEVRMFANSLGNGSASAGYRPEGHLWVTTKHWYDCPGCPVELTQRYYEAGLPQYKQTNFGGSGKLDVGVSPATQEHLDEVGLGNRKDIASSEPLARMKALFPPGTPFLRGVALSTRGDLLGKLEATDLETIPSFSSLSATAGPTLLGTEGLAFSATKKRLYVLGGINGSGNPKNDGWWLDLGGSTPTWRRFTMPTGETVGAVLAMVYRHEDEAIYFVDLSNRTLRLRRWNAQRKVTRGKLETLATFPVGWDGFPNYALVAGPEGELGIVGYGRTGTEATRFGRIAVDRASRVSLDRLTKSTIAIASDPALSLGGFVYTTDRFQGGLLKLSSMPAPAPADLPTLLPH